MKKKKKEVNQKQSKGKDFIVFIIIAFAMVFLTSSFIVEDVYNYADKITMTPEGVKEIYSVSIGQKSFADEAKNENNSTQQQTQTVVQPTATPTVAPSPTPATTPVPSAQNTPANN